jgi:VIT1/CCC1 family predicted Fe2+/Mn2+ transporter
MLKSILSAVPVVAAAGLFGASVGYIADTNWQVTAGLAAGIVAVMIGRDIWTWRNF